MDKLFVSRGGIKLQAALEKFRIDVKNKVVLDVGSSTGGFVDCLLQNGAKKVYAIDTAYGELAWKLRNDPKVIPMERTNILYLDHLEGDMGKVSVVTIDAGWTKLELILPVIRKFLEKDGVIIALLKPQYEANKKELIKGVVSLERIEQVKEGVIKKIYDLQFKIYDQIKSPTKGRGGNIEYLLLIKLS